MASTSDAEEDESDEEATSPAVAAEKKEDDDKKAREAKQKEAVPARSERRTRAKSEERKERSRHRRRRRRSGQETERDRSRGRDRRSPESRRERRETRLRTAASVGRSRGAEPPPEPALPPRHVPSVLPPPPPPPPAVPKDGGKGNKKGPQSVQNKVRCDICHRYVSSTAKAAMDQHQYLNEQCIAVQCWNGFSREQKKDAAMWHKAKEMAKKIKISRENASGVPEEEDLRGSSPCSVRSFGRGQSRGPSSSHAATVAEKAAPLEEVTKSKKTHPDLPKDPSCRKGLFFKSLFLIKIRVFFF